MSVEAKRQRRVGRVDGSRGLVGVDVDPARRPAPVGYVPPVTRTWFAPAAVAGLITVVGAAAWSAPRQGSVWLVALVGVVGALLVGPWLAYNVERWVGWRVVLPLLVGYVPSRTSLGKSRACCTDCGAASGRLAGVMLTWSLRGGRCRGCGSTLPWRVAVVEAATGLLLGLGAWRLGWSWRLAPALVLAAGMVAIAAVDLVHHRIPIRFVVLTGLGCAVTGMVSAIATGHEAALLAAATGSLIYGGMMSLLYLVSPNGLGGGDVRLAWLVGGVVGGVTWSADLGSFGAVSAVLAVALLSSAIGLLTHLVAAVLRRTGSSRSLPFGPAMGAGALLVMFLAQPA